MSAQKGATCVNVGIMIWFTTIVIWAAETTDGLLGVNVYVVVVELFNAGDHVPE